METNRRDQFVGCVLGLATGDALGAPYEGGLLERFVWRLIGRTPEGRLRWTDDTQMACDLAEALLEARGLDPDALARRFAHGYRWSRGYGPGTARVLRRIRAGQDWRKAVTSVREGGSLGNGASMRAPVVALFFANDADGLVEATKTSAGVTHAHALGIEGAVLIAVTTRALLERMPRERVIEVAASACSSDAFSERVATARTWLATGRDVPEVIVAKTLGNGITAVTSCVTALYVALRHLDMPFEIMMGFIVGCGGDVDTIGAMAGALWGAHNGAARLPDIDLEAKEQLVDLAARLFEHAVQ